jgi:microcystin-dependent protein
MLISAIPAKLPKAFADSGTKNTIPTPSQSGITPGAASLTDGFPPLTFTPLASGGVPPAGADMNGILYEISSAVKWANAGGMYPYDSAFSTAIGGYPLCAMLQKADGSGFWVSTVDGNTTNPDAAGAGWVEFSPIDTTGDISFTTQSSAPTGKLKANGAAVSRTTYARLFAKIGTTYGIGDGSTTFNVPDIRGEFVRGWDDSRGIDSGRTLGSWQKGSLVAIDVAIPATETTSVAAATTAAQAQAVAGYDAYNTSDYAGASISGSNYDGTATLPGTSEVYSGIARPRNVALLACIKY